MGEQEGHPHHQHDLQRRACILPPPSELTGNWQCMTADLDTARTSVRDLCELGAVVSPKRGFTVSLADWRLLRQQSGPTWQECAARTTPCQTIGPRSVTLLLLWCRGREEITQAVGQGG